MDYKKAGVDIEAGYKSVELGDKESVALKEKTDEIAKVWESAYGGNKDAQYGLAVCYANGNGIAKDEGIARQWLLKAADAGHVKSQLLASEWLIKGIGGAKDPETGVKYCEKAASQDDPEAIAVLGYYYFDGKIIPQDYPKAIASFNRASEKGSESAAYMLGYCYREGLGVETNAVKAFEYFKLADERKSLPGAYALGVAYENGVGVTVDYTEALGGYTRASEAEWEDPLTGNTTANAKTGCDRIGEIGKYWKSANAENNAEAQYHVGLCFANGTGVAKNLEAAYRLADLNPLGSAAGYGVPLPLDRQRTSELLGFSRPIHNCFGASMARGECEASLLSALAQLMCVLSRLAEDMILFSMPEFAYFKLPREYCTGSSIMPQKFNPDVLELVRGKTAQVIGWQTAALTLLHAMPGGYNRDLQDAKLLYMKGLATTRTTLRILAKVVKGLKVNAANCRAAFTPGVFATDVALRMVAKGTPWRDAYHEVRDHLEMLDTEDCDTVVRQKKHEGTCLGVSHDLYQKRISDAVCSAESRRKALDQKCKALISGTLNL